MIKLTLSVAVLLFGVSATSQKHGIKQLAFTKGRSQNRIQALNKAHNKL
jgi:hypothetical protein